MTTSPWGRRRAAGTGAVLVAASIVGLAFAAPATAAQAPSNGWPVALTRVPAGVNSVLLWSAYNSRYGCVQVTPGVDRTTNVRVSPTVNSNPVTLRGMLYSGRNCDGTWVGNAPEQGTVPTDQQWTNYWFRLS